MRKWGLSSGHCIPNVSKNCCDTRLLAQSTMMFDTFKPINVPHPYRYTWIKYLFMMTGIITSFMVTFYLCKCIFCGCHFLDRKVQQYRKEREKVKELMNLHEELTRNRKRKTKNCPSAPQLPAKTNHTYSLA